MPLTTQDRLDILELLARYNHAVDLTDAEAWADTFAADGVFEIDGRGIYRGRDEILAYGQEVAARPRRSRRHFTNNVIIEGNGDAATMTLYLMVTQASDHIRPVLTGVYRDRLRRVDGAWRFEHRHLTPDASE